MAQEDQDQIMIKNLRSDVEGACLLLSYAAQSGLELEIDTATVITKSKELLATGKLTGDEEAKFYFAYEALAKLASPVTVAGLSAATEANQTVNRYWVYPFFIWLAILLIVQIYWVIGSTATTAIKESRDEITKVTMELGALKERLQSEKKALKNSETDKLETQIRNLRNKKFTYYSILDRWNLIPKVTDPDKKEDEKDKGVETLAMANFVLIALQGYVLPLLYGLLGAYIYVLRMLSNEIRNLTYTGKSYIRYKVRVVLGTLSGLAVTWFFQPGAEILKSLSPLALAFLAGYSVEILFAVMDKFVGAFSGKTPTQEKAQ
ncbi:MAG: hypothetical protein WC405_05750 [Syntrophales bacterium]